MKTLLYTLLVILLLLGGSGLAILTNSGILTFSKPYIVGRSAELLPSPDMVAFVNVNVVSMESERVQPAQTVVVQEGRIAQVGSVEDVEVPASALRIDGTGQTLMPGLTDAHVHIKDKDELLLFLAHGVTSVRDMWGTTGLQLWLGFPDQQQLRDQIDEGTLLGPTIYAAGPILEGGEPTMPLMPVYETAEGAREAVTWQAEQGYEYVKVYDKLEPDVYQAILDSAAEHNLPVVGHAPIKVGIDGVLAGGQRTIEHLSGYIDSDAAAFRIPVDQLASYAARTREAGVWNCPTLGVYTKLVPDAEVARLEARPGMEYVPPVIRQLWRLFWRQERDALTYPGENYVERIAAMNIDMVQALHAAGAGFILGTDTDNPYQIPGLSALEELEAMVAAGLTPYEALAAGTRNAALALGQPDDFGTIAPGKRADLVLLRANPLDDVSAVRKRAGVMAQGRWFTEAELQAMLAELAASYQPSWLQRLWPLGLLAAAIALVVRRLPGRNKR